VKTHIKAGKGVDGNTYRLKSLGLGALASRRAPVRPVKSRGGAGMGMENGVYED
jgi:hypothetical protein